MNTRDDLVRRWLYLMMRIRAKCDAIEKFWAIEKAYGESHRAYHTLEHVRSCLDELESARAHALNYDAVELALWFHDLVCNPRRDDNEEQSANHAFAFCASADLVRHARPVEQMIRASKHTDILVASRVEDRPDAELFLDIDLSVLGQPVDVFDRYETDIRKEYRLVADDAAFRAGRTEILKAFFARPFLYRTEFFRKKYEAAARDNLARSIARLADGAGAG